MDINDRELLARIIEAEAGNQGIRGMTAVGNVIRNRMAGGNSLRDVVLARGQFSPLNTYTGYAGGEQGQDMANLQPSKDAYAVADAILSGSAKDITGGATHFYNPSISNPSWGQQAGGDWSTIGDQVFGQAGGFPVGEFKPKGQTPVPQTKEQAMNAPQAQGLMGLLGRLGQPNEQTGLSPFQNFAQALDPLIMPEMRGGQAIRAGGQRRMAEQTKNRTMQELEKLASGGNKLAIDLLGAVRAGAMSPAEAYKALMTQKYDTSRDTIRSTQRFLNGTYYVVTDAGPKVYNPSGKLVTGDEAERVLAEANRFEIDNRALGVGLSEAQKLQQQYADNAFTKAEQISSSIGNIDEAIAAIDRGAERNVFMNLLPDITEQSASLTSALRRMGLDVISSVTFGALSESELNIAMATAYPPNASSQELRKFLVDRKNALQKLRKYTEEAAMFLSNPNNTRADWMEIVRGRRDQNAASGMQNPYMNMSIDQLNEVYSKYNELTEAQKQQFVEALNSKKGQ
jgi:hypothetical protein